MNKKHIAPQTRQHVRQAMRSAVRQGVDPRNSHSAFERTFERQERMRQGRNARPYTRSEAIANADLSLSLKD